MARVARALTAPFVRFEITGGACAPRVGVVIIASNHRSLFDVVAGLIGLHHFRRYPRILIARRYVEGKWTAPFARAIGAIPVDRGAGAAALQEAIAALDSGIDILVMPEGRLHWDPEHPLHTGPASKGISRLSVGTGVPVVAAGLSGTQHVWPATSRLPRLNPFRRPTVSIRVADEELVLVGEDHAANTDLVMTTIEQLLAETAA